MRTERAALIACLSLLAACAPQAGDSGADAMPQAAAIEPAVPGAPATAQPEAQHPGGQAAAGCTVSNDVYDVDDVRIYCRMPADVQAFLARENTCQHFAGEEPYDDERRRELEEAGATYCEGREKIFTALLARYQGDCAIRDALIGINARYDLVPALDMTPCQG